MRAFQRFGEINRVLWRRVLQNSSPNMRLKKHTKKEESYQKPVKRYITRNKILGVGLLKSTNRRRYGDLIKKIREAYVLGEDKYPKPLEKAFVLLTHARG